MAKVYSVSQVNNYISGILGNDFLLKRIAIKGEISNCKYHGTGHIYFSIKDENSSMPCMMFSDNVRTGLKFTLKDGQAVIIEGRIGVYQKDGKYQLYAQKIEMDGDGEGQLTLKFLQLKQRLSDEGLFDFDVKKEIPAFPKKVGIVTAATGAAIQDIISVSKRRNPYVELILYPAKVQGEGAAATIARGIEVLDRMGLDTIIIGRGGGSIEDLWAFNEEVVARAIYAAKTPIISGTGHEINITIADYVADKRAATPSAAAELAIPNIMEEVRKNRQFRTALDRQITEKLQRYQLKLRSLVSALEKENPEVRLREKQQYLMQQRDKLDALIRTKYQKYERRLAVDVASLHGLSPTAKLINGFGYIEVKKESDGAGVVSGPLRTITDVEEGDLISVTVSDGSLDAKVLGKNLYKSEG